MHNKYFILHLTLIEDIGPAVIQKILLRSSAAKASEDFQQGYGGQVPERSDMQISDLYSFSQIDWMNTFGFTESIVEKLVTGLASTKLLEEELVLIERHNIQWATVQEEVYPQLLREIYLPPSVLYWQGMANFSDMKKLLSIVGARKADAYGYQVVNALVPDLVAAEYSIVSGGAKGIDTMAHEATIKSGGKTIAVLGSGLLHSYPAGNTRFFKSIVDHGGLIVSSFPLRMEPLPGHFPARNRIITGLSHGCLVVQAAQKSGALISAHYAMEQGREVFAVPGSIGDELSVGCNTLIQSGAKLVMNSADILTEFGDRVIIDNRVIQEKAKQLSILSPLSVRPAASSEVLTKEEVVEGNERKKADLYSHYSSQQKQIITACKKLSSLDDIVNVTQLTTQSVQSELFNLQLDGVLEQDFTGMWIASRL